MSKRHHDRPATSSAPSPPPVSSRWLPVLLLLFAGSGAAALIYEIVWFQLLELVIGSSAVSLGVLLATFMGGMCLGSLLVPRFVPTSYQPLRVYAALEFGIGVLGILALLVVPLVGRVYSAHVGYGFLGLLLRAIVGGVCLLPASILMGATLPVAARWLKATPRGVAGVGLLYSANTAGAVVGCLLAGFYLLRVYDTVTATLVAAMLNGLLVATALIVPAQREDGRASDQSGEVSIALAPKTRLVYLAIAASGFCALGAQVIWTRLLALILGATVYTFSVILAVFLFGLWIGSGAAALLSRRLVQPRLMLGVCQMLLTLAIAWAAYSVTQFLPYWSLDPGMPTSPAVALQVDLMRTIWAVLPAACLWGASFPLALAATALNPADPARPVAGVYAANTVGAILGALATSLWLIPSAGTQRAQQVLIGLSGVTAIFLLAPLAWSSEKPLRIGRLAALAASAGLAVVLLLTVVPTPGLAIACGRYPASCREMKILYSGEGVNSSVAVTSLPDGTRSFHVSGKVEASTGLPDMRLQRMLGNIPALLHRAPKSVLVVGFGAGVTAGSFVPYPEVGRIVICEIEPLVVRQVGEFFAKENYHVLADPRASVIEDDARHYLLTSQESFDIITSDPIHPWVKGAAALYTKEYFELVKRHLNPGGVVAQWVPLYDSAPDVVKSQIATFFEVFPNGTIWSNYARDASPDAGQGYDLVLIGQSDATTLDLDGIQQKLNRADHQSVAASLREVELGSPVQLLATYAGREADLRPWLKDAVVNLDRNLRLQYLAGLATLESRSDSSESIYNEMIGYRRFPDEQVVGSEAEKREFRSAMASVSPCRLSDADSTLIQSGLAGWEQVSRDALKLELTPLPWIVLFDGSCAWHLNADATLLSNALPVNTSISFAGHHVDVRARSHTGTVWLPSGVEVTARPMASAAPYRNGSSAFVALAMPEVWRGSLPDANGPPLDEFLAEAFVYQMTRARQLGTTQRRLEDLAQTFTLPANLDEDVVQEQFEKVPGFRQAIEAERDVFLRAAVAPDAATRRELTARGLSMAGKRRAQYYAGSNRVYVELEDLFLTHSGVGRWAAYKLARARGRAPSDAELFQFVRGKDSYWSNDWSQEEGFALFLLLDDLVPGWQMRVLGPTPASPLQLLERTIS